MTVPLSVSLEVIGAGWGRTGTLSLKRALELCGFGPTYHCYSIYDGDVIRWLNHDLGVLDGYRSTVDWPACNYWRELTAVCPAAKVVLSVRHPEQWYASFDRTVGMVIRRAHRPPTGVQWVDDLYRFTRDVIEAPAFGYLAGLSKSDVIAAYLAHNRRVQEALPPNRLLVHYPEDGWGPLTSFLGCETPPCEYPRVNDASTFWQLHSARPNSAVELAELFRPWAS